MLNLFGLHAQSDPAGDPTSSSGDFDGVSTTGGGYDTYTGNGKRTITDVTVPGVAGAIPLQFARTYSSRYTAVPTAVQGGFGDAGWRHSYQWAGQITTTNGVTTYQVGYPDGRVINFRMNRAHQVSDFMAHGPAPTPDRFAINPNGDGLHYLHLADGSQVQFSVQLDSNGVADLLRAEVLIDPYQAVTRLSYGSYQPTVSGTPPVTVLDHVTDPSGRTLFLKYGTQYFPNDPNYWVVINEAYWNDSQGTKHKDATYGYYVYGPGRPNELNQTTIYCALNHVTYKYTAQNDLTASYTYYAANNPGTLGSAPPLLVTADDPVFTGPMHRIRYQYLPATNYGVWGIVQAEQNYSTRENVTSLTQDIPNTPNTVTESRGDYTNSTRNVHVSRSFTYGQSSAGPIPSNARPFQVTTATDYQGNPTYTSYQPKDDIRGWGNIAQIIDAAGHSTAYKTEGLVGKVTQVTLSDGRNRKTAWAGVDPATHYQQLTTNYPYFVTSTTDERGQTTYYYRYANTGYVYQINYPDGANEYFTYTPPFAGPNGAYYKIATYYNKLGAKFTFNYGQNDDGQGPADLLRSVTRTYTEPVTNNSHTETISYTYDPQDRVQSVRDQRNVTEQFTYDLRGNIRQVTHSSDPNQGSIIFDYDNNINCIGITDERGHKTIVSYDDYRRVTSVQVPVNAPSANGSQVVNRTRWFAYDRRDNQDLSIGTAASHTANNWSVSWLPSGSAIQRIFSANNWLTDEYDGMYVDGSKNPVVPTPGNGATHQGVSQFNALGQPLTTTDPEGFATTYTYDNYNRPSTVTDPLGVAGVANHITTRTYYGAGEKASSGSSIDCTGLLKSITAPGPDLTNFPTALTQFTSYDKMGRLLASIDPYNHTFNSGVNAAGNLTSQDDGLHTGAQATQYAYDQLGRKCQITYPVDNTTEQWTYDASGNLSTYKNRAGKTCTYTYMDGAYPVTRCSGYSWNDGITPNANYYYYPNGLLKEAANPSSDIQYTYDDSNALTVENEVIAGLNWKTTKYSHDVDGNVDSITYPNGNYPCFTHDSQGRVTSMYSYGTTFSAYNYSGDRLASRSLYNGFYTSYEYQNNGRIWDVWHVDGTHGKNVSRHLYGHAPDGRISWFDREYDAGNPGLPASGSSLENGRGDVFYYWPDGSLGGAARDVVANGGWPQAGSSTADSRVAEGNVNYSGGSANTYYNSYTYDAAGNRSHVTQMNQAAIDYGADGENRYYGSVYDGNSNTINSVVGWTYSYDAENKLVAASSTDGTQTLQFVYDAAGRMIKQVANGVVTYFSYSGVQRIEEYNASNLLVYLYFYDTPGSDQLLFRQGGPWGRLWYQHDAMGNTTHLSAEQFNSQGQIAGGYVVEQYLYDAYGTPTVYNAAGAPLTGSQYDNRYLFKSVGGYVWYPQARLYYCRARFYLPQHGRFLQPDPVGQAGGLNVYSYCHNDPINTLDPSGLYLIIIGYTPQPVYEIDPYTGYEYLAGFIDVPLYIDVPGNIPSSGGVNNGGNTGKTGGNGGAGGTGGATPAPAPAPSPHLVPNSQGLSEVLKRFGPGGSRHDSNEFFRKGGIGAAYVSTAGLGAGFVAEAAPVVYGFVATHLTLTSTVATTSAVVASHPEEAEQILEDSEYLFHGTISTFGNSIMTKGLEISSVLQNSWDRAYRGFFLTPNASTAEDYALARAGEMSYRLGGEFQPIVLKIQMNVVQPFLQTTRGALGELEYYIRPEDFNKIPPSAFSPQ